MKKIILMIVLIIVFLSVNCFSDTRIPTTEIDHSGAVWTYSKEKKIYVVDFHRWEVIKGDLLAVHKHLLDQYIKGGVKGKIYTRNNAPKGYWWFRDLDWDTQYKEKYVDKIDESVLKGINLEIVKTIFIYEMGIVFWFKDRTSYLEVLKFRQRIR